MDFTTGTQVWYGSGIGTTTPRRVSGRLRIPLGLGVGIRICTHMLGGDPVNGSDSNGLDPWWFERFRNSDGSYTNIGAFPIYIPWYHTEPDPKDRSWDPQPSKPPKFKESFEPFPLYPGSTICPWGSKCQSKRPSKIDCTTGSNG
ncbi:hypothetical protein CCP4SC76_510005 [Gammaproteobacteria bacterium]